MIKKAIKYKDYDGNDVEKEFWFNLDAGEIALLELSKKDGLSEWLKTAQENEDSTVVGPAFEKIVLTAVGRREGDKFKKDAEAYDDLRWTGAYSALIMWMLTNPLEAADFVNGMMPSEAQQALKDSKGELVEKMRAKTEAMKAVEASLNIEASAFPVDPPQEVVVHPETVELIETAASELPDFSAMSPEEFTAWQELQQQKG